MIKSITTKFGDSGETRLYSGETINKRSRRIMACGDIDELVSVLGVAKANLDNYLDEFQKVYNDLEWIQKQLFVVASNIATTEPKLSQLKEKIDASFLEQLDISRDNLEHDIELPKGFVLPGGISCYLDLARSVCRRTEREIVGCYNEGLIDNKYILMWINRLSDYLYLLARDMENGNYKMVKEKEPNNK